jgi:putative oxidoreductase
MSDTLSAGLEAKSNNAAKNERHPDWEWWAILYLRLALGASFLSGIADRIGLYRGRNVGYGNFAGFMHYTAKVNSFMPAFTIPFLAWAATAAEFSLGLALVLGIWLRWAALGSSLLLILFGTAMAISFGIKSPLDYSVFSASAGALLLALYHTRRPKEAS